MLSSDSTEIDIQVNDLRCKLTLEILYQHKRSINYNWIPYNT